LQLELPICVSAKRAALFVQLHALERQDHGLGC
jgi:hypothetical protein